MIKNVIFDLGNVLINNDPSEYIKALGYSKEKSEALNEAISSDTLWHDKDMGIYERAKELGYSIYLLTNYSIDGFAHLESSFDFIREVQGRVVSSHIHLCKPDKRIYELLLDKYDLKASECIFFDDNLANIMAAEELGIQAVLFIDIEEALKILEQSQKQF